jgi:hypothetical protein
LDALDLHFDYKSPISGTKAEKVGNPKNIVKIVYEQKKQILFHEIEPNPLRDRAMHEKDNPSF